MIFRSTRPRLPIALLLMAVAAAASASAAQGCGSDVQIASTTTGSTAAATAGSGGQGAAGPGSSGSSGLSSSGAGGAIASSGAGGAIASSSAGGGGCPGVALCQNHIYACGDGIDNDGDGLIDSADPDCLGACDNTEENYNGNIPGQTNGPCRTDCYFDADTGSGNDECYWSHECDPHEVPPEYSPESQYGSACAYDPAASIPGTLATCADLHAAQSPNCHAYCDPLTPNGCDCFGCCELPAGGGKYVWLGSEDNFGSGTCDLAHAADPTKCRPCEPVPGCLNLCDPCELCIGKGAVPGGCSAQDQCAPGIKPCGLPGQGCCPAGTYCVTGCCQPTPM